jgi:hypothetical protein
MRRVAIIGCADWRSPPLRGRFRSDKPVAYPSRSRVLANRLGCNATQCMDALSGSTFHSCSGSGTSTAGNDQPRRKNNSLLVAASLIIFRVDGDAALRRISAAC